MDLNTLSKDKLIKEIKHLKSNIRILKSEKKTTKNNAKFSKIKKDKGELNRFKNNFKKISFNQKEREKELNAVYKIFTVLNKPFKPREKLYNSVINLITKAYQYPEITVVRLILKDKEFRTKRFKKTIWKQSNTLYHQGIKIGELEVYYLKKCKKEDEGPFLKKERRFIDSVSNLLCQRYERREMYDFLTKSESRFKILTDKAPVPIAISRSGYYIYVNRKYLEIFGYKNLNELKGKRVIEQVAPQSREELIQRILDRKKGLPVPNAYVVLCQRKNGKQFPVFNYVTTINLNDGPANIAFATDITEQKNTEKKLQDYSQQLKNYGAHLQTIREEERIYISRELHDNLGQSLTALKIELFRAIKIFSEIYKNRPPEKMIMYVQNMIALVDSILLSTKNIARKIRPKILDNLGLLAAIEWQVEEFIKTTEIKCNLVTSVRKIIMDKAHSIGVFRIIQEALTNIARHSNACKVLVSIKENNRFTTVKIIDNGIGINERNINSTKTLGLLGMKERAQVFGGDLSIEGEKDKGTKITLKIPKN